MDGKQGLVGLAGIGLILANFWLGGARQTVSQGALSGSATSQQTAAAHSTLKVFAGEILVVGVAVVLAGTSDGLANAMLAIITALWILWAINHYTKG